MSGSYRWRYRLLAGALLAALAIFWVRLFFLQVVDHERFNGLAELQHTEMVPIPADRGKVYDRNGRILATSVTAKSVYCVPADISDVNSTALALGRALHMRPQEVAASINARREKYFLWVKRLVTAEEEAAVRALRLDGVDFREEPRRYYPNGTMLAHVIGFTGVDQRGLAGVEYSLDSRLRGTDGWREERRDGLARSIYGADDKWQPAVNGNSIVLTIDSNVQDFLESAVDRCQQQYAPLSVTGIVLDPRTGEILALAERPTFDPNRYSAYPKDTWRPRAITDPFEPGSMFKPFIFAAALEERSVRPDDVIFCGNGSFQIGKRMLHDAHPYGNLTARDIVVKSSNIGMARIAFNLGPAKAYSFLRNFGFGRQTGLELASEEPGYVVPLQKWSHYTLSSVPMGHEVSVTAVQAAAAFAAFANGGTLVKPRLVRGVVAPDGTVLERHVEPVIQAQVLKPETARMMLTDILYKVVKDGTGRLADLETYNVAGKTGTAQKLVAGRYSHSKYVSSFICTGPTEDPRAVVLIVVNEPSRGASFYGGTAAAPYAAEVLEATLDYMFIDGRRRTRPADYAAATITRTAGAAGRAEGGNAP